MAGLFPTAGSMVRCDRRNVKCLRDQGRATGYWGSANPSEIRLLVMRHWRGRFAGGQRERRTLSLLSFTASIAGESKVFKSSRVSLFSR